MNHIRKVFQKLTNRGLKIKASKCRSAHFEIPLLGHLTTANGVRFDDVKLLAIRQASTPTTPTKLSSFLCLAK